MRRPQRPVLLIVVLLLAPVLAALGTGVAQDFDESPRGVYVPLEMRAWPAFDDAGNVIGSQTWRVAMRTGNCCENYLALSPTGRLVDLGGDFPMYTDDRGATWRLVPHTLAPLTGEGAVAIAPDGDILAVTWDAYAGDRLLTWKHDAQTDTWSSGIVALHHAFYDRPWLAVVPGPIHHLGQTHPYAVLMQSNFLDLEMHYSFDGVTYLPLDLAPLPRGLTGRTQAHLDQPPVAWADWVQPIGATLLTPLPAGGALLARGTWAGCEYTYIRTDLQAECRDVKGVSFTGEQVLRVDSRGRLHDVSAFRSGASNLEDRLSYRVSDDGGRTWRWYNVTVPLGQEVVDGHQLDVAVRGDLDSAAIAYEVRDEQRKRSRIEVLKITDLSQASWSTERLQVGNGDELFGHSFGAADRLDFVSVVMFPDGRVATTFRDGAHSPSVAIEMG